MSRIVDTKSCDSTTLIKKQNVKSNIGIAHRKICLRVYNKDKTKFKYNVFIDIAENNN